MKLPLLFHGFSPFASVPRLEAVCGEAGLATASFSHRSELGESRAFASGYSFDMGPFGG